MKPCIYCGAQNPDNHNFCAGCGAPLNIQQPQQTGPVQQTNPSPYQQTPYQQGYQYPPQPTNPSNKKKSGCLIAIAVALLLFSIFGIILTISTAVNDSDDVSTSEVTESSCVTEEAVTTKDDYINACQQYAYKDISRNPNDYKGKLATFTGQVIQVQESTFLGQKSVTLRVNVTAEENQFVDGGYIYEDTVYVTYYPDENESRILEDDIVTLYGELDGLETYTSILGESISIPSMKAKYVEIKD